jgi:proteic killer suppression protein
LPSENRDPFRSLSGVIGRSRRAASVKQHLTFAVHRITFPAVIRSFRDRALRRYFETGDPSGLSVPNVARVSRMLRALDAATRPEQVNLPGFYWHLLQGEARWSIRVTGNWRITFAWDGGDPVAVDLEDYH